MESLRDILKRKQTLTNISKANTDAWSSVNQPQELSASSDCPLCKGAGFVYPRLTTGKPDFSQVTPCQCIQNKLKQEKLAYLEQYSNLASLSHLTFETLLPTGRQGHVVSQKYFSRAYEAAKNFAANPKGWLILFGPSGCGKTHLACAIANYRLNLRQPVFYIETSDLLDHLRSTFAPTTDTSYDELFERVKNTPLLILEDLSLAGATPWAKEKLEQLLNHRFNLRLPAVITTDVPLEKLEERVRIKLTDPDFCQVFVVEEKLLPDLEPLRSLSLELLSNMTFDNFDRRRLNLLPEQRQNLEQAFRIALNFAQSPQGWLVFQGGNGCGKTHLAAAIANYQLQAGKPVSFVIVPDLLDHLRSAFSPESRVSYDELFERVKKAPLLILDDFGEQATTPWAQEKLYQLINYRYNARLPTVITTGFSLDEIERRISSRMVDPTLSLVFNIVAPDYRGDLKASRTAKFTRGLPKRSRQI